MAVQTRSVLKTYFETGEKPTSAQFGALIDSALMAKVEVASSTINSAANTIYNIPSSNGATTVTVNVQLNEGESIIVNKFITSQPNFTLHISYIGSLYKMSGYDDVAISGPGVMSYAILCIENGNSDDRTYLINRAYYKS